MAAKNDGAVEKTIVSDPMSVKWMEKYDESFSKFWSKFPQSVRSILTALATFLFGISISGSWISVITHLAIQFDVLPRNSQEDGLPSNWSDIVLERLALKDFSYFWISSNLVSFVIYYATGGFLHWYYYVNRRSKAEEWKCQPKKWLSPELERHEIFIGTISLCVNATFGAVLSCRVYNGAYSTIYHGMADYGWLWFFLQIPIVFVYMDFATYWLHRMYHWPVLYKNFHKLHHKYKQPTAFSVTAIHPVESVHIQMTLILPMFFIPVHPLPFYSVILYIYIHGILDHSGINFKAQWWQPWQPDTIFHDNHHQYFHVNFAFNMEIWDKIFGTYRQKDRIYREDLFYGQGKALSEVTPEEMAEELEERSNENPLAYHENVMLYKLDDEELEKVKKQ